MKKFLVAVMFVCLLVDSGNTVRIGIPLVDEETVFAESVFVIFREMPGPAERALISRAAGKSIVRGRRGDVSSERPGKVKYLYTIVPAIAAELSQAEIAKLKNHPKVDRIEKDVEIFAADAELDNSWGVAHIGAGYAHDDGTTGAGVKVAVLDSGIDYNHEDLDDNYAGGYDFVNDDNDPMDDNGHGTHIAGIIAAEDNGLGVVGVAPGVSLYAVKVLNSAAVGHYSNIIAALEWCIDNNVDIANHSYYSVVNPGDTVRFAYSAAYSAGVLHVACAGNEGNVGGTGNNIGYPARWSTVIAVGATQVTDVRASFSSTGSQLELSAPGVSVKSTLLSGGYGTKTGTSQASPHVAGLAALTLEDNSGFNPGQIRSDMQANATDLGDPNRDYLYGYGLIVAGAPPGAPPAAPVAAFSGTPTSGDEPLSVTFTDASTGTISTWAWVFGDGGTSNAENPGYVYTSAGDYTVVLTATGPGGSDDETKVDYISVTAVAPPPLPVAAFSGTPTSGIEPLTVTFTDTSTNTTSWAWTFGDGESSNVQNPSYEYASQGIYTVSLTATGPGGSDSETKANYITVLSPGGVQAALRVQVSGVPINVTTATITSLTTDRLLSGNDSKVVTSTDLASWVTGTTDRVSIADDGDGTITLSGPQDLATDSSPTFNDVIINEGVWHDVRAYGAVGNGATDDSAAFQAAIDAASSGGKVYIPPATYNLDSSLLLDDSGITIVGAGAGSVLRFTNAGNGFYLDDSEVINFITIANLTLETTNAAATSAIYADGTTFAGIGWKITNVNIQVSGAGVWDYGIRTKNIQSSAMENVYVAPGAGATCISFETTSNQWDVSGLSCGGSYAVGVNIASAGISISGSTIQGNISDTAVRVTTGSSHGGAFIGSWIENVGAGDGIDIVSTQAYSITGNVIAASSGTAILVGNGGTANAISIISNSFDDPVTISATSNRTVMIGNRFFGAGITDNGIRSTLLNNHSNTGVYKSDKLNLYDTTMHQVAAATNQGLVLNYELDEGSGTVIFDSGTSGDFDATLVGNATWVSGLAGTALDFPGDGTADYAIVGTPGLDLAANFTLEVMVNLDSLGGSQSFIVYGYSDGAWWGNWWIGLDGVNQLLYGFYDDGDTGYRYTNSDNRGQLNVFGHWYHVVVTYDGSETKLYVDGELINTHATGSVTPRGSTNYVMLGRGTSDTAQSYFNGQIEFARVYDRVLTAEEISSYYLRTAAQKNVTITDSYRILGTDFATELSVVDDVATFTGALGAPTLNTGEGDNELFDMDQNVQTSDTPQFLRLGLGVAADDEHEIFSDGTTLFDYTAGSDSAVNYTVHQVDLHVADLDADSLLHVLHVTAAGTTSGEVAVIGTYPRVQVIHQHLGTFVTLNQTNYAARWPSGGGWTAGIDGIQIFVADNDTILIGSGNKFDALEVLFGGGGVVASKDLKPDFEYYDTGTTWQPFVPADGTAGFISDGVISFDPNDFTNWKSNYNPGGGGAGYFIRIIRTRNPPLTPPTPTTIKILASTFYGWDENADLTINDIAAVDATVTGNLILGAPTSHTVTISGFDAAESLTADITGVFSSDPRIVFIEVYSSSDPGTDENMLFTLGFYRTGSFNAEDLIVQYVFNITYTETDGGVTAGQSTDTVDTTAGLTKDDWIIWLEDDEYSILTAVPTATGITFAPVAADDKADDTGVSRVTRIVTDFKYEDADESDEIHIMGTTAAIPNAAWDVKVTIRVE